MVRIWWSVGCALWDLICVPNKLMGASLGLRHLVAALKVILMAALLVD